MAIVRNKLMNTTKIFTIDQLTQCLTVSIPTARRRLAAWNAHTSYSHNGRYYTLPHCPQFNENGLWEHMGVFFSKHGNLTRTLVHLLLNAPAGYSASELEQILHLPTRSFLAPFRHHPQLTREKSEGRYIWLAADPVTKAKQLASRLTMANRQKLADLPSNAQAVAVLAELIRQPQMSPQELSLQLTVAGHMVTPEQIENLLIKHGLVKKTADSVSS